VLPDRKKSTYQELFKELKSIAASMGQTWQPEQIMSDFETGLMPAVSTEVKVPISLSDTSTFVLVSYVCS
jgi:hypothetical protein